MAALLIASASLAAIVNAGASPRLSPAASQSGDGANLHVSKTVASAGDAPLLALSLAVDRNSAIPGDALTYSAVVSNTGSTVTLAGDLVVVNKGQANSTIAFYYDVVSRHLHAPCNNPDQVDHGHDDANWAPIAGTSVALGGFAPEHPAPLGTGLQMVLTPVAASGVVYPASGDPIVGTRLLPGAQATWHYSATISLSPAQTIALFNSGTNPRVRNTLHVEPLVRGGKSEGAPPTVDVDFCGLLFNGRPTGAASNVVVTIAPPQSAPVTFNQTSTPALALLQQGTSVSVSTRSIVPFTGAKSSSETDAAYLARLAAIEGARLLGTATATGGSSSGPVAAPPATSTPTVEHLPVVSLVKSGPAKADAGTTQAYSLALTNSGGAPASGLALTDAVAGGGSGTVSGTPAALAPAQSAVATAAFAIPGGQPEGPLTDTASVTWRDANANLYGPVSSQFNTQVSSSFFGATLTLSPAMAGPDLLGVSQALSATFLDRAGNPIANKTISFTVTGANATAGAATTDSSGHATFAYSGSHSGTDSVLASFASGSLVINSNVASVSWVKPTAAISSAPVQGNFYVKNASQAFFGARPGDTPAFGQTFPTLNFNPPAGIVNHNISGVDPNRRPFTDITTDSAGNFSGTIVAQGNGLQAGVGTLAAFDAVFTSSFIIANAGDVTLHVIADDGFLLGIGNGATRVSGVYENPPPSNTSPFLGYPLAGAWNQSSGSSPGTYSVTIHFPAAGIYPYELDYFECCGQQLSLTLAVAQFTADTSPLSVYVGYADGLRPAGSVFPFPWDGSPNVTFIGNGQTAYDAGAIRFDNNSDLPIVLDDVSVDIGTTHLDLWGSNIVIQPHGITILTQTVGNNFDTSDFPITCTPTGVIPKVNITQAGVVTTFSDTAQVLNTGGIDPPSCGTGNESIPWTRIGGGGTAINVPLPPAGTLALTPATSGPKLVGSAQTLSVAAVDDSGQVVQGLAVSFGVFGANPQTIVALTDPTGVATARYIALNAGTDTITATAFISGLREVSNSLSLTWVIPVPGGGGGGGGGGTPAQAPPVIAAPSPADGTIVTKPIPVATTITPPAGQTIASWSVTATSAHGLTVTLASGTGAPPSPLATFDPTTLPNDVYTITVIGITSAGGAQAATTSVIVQGALKPGRFVMTYQDAVLPVDGFQLGVRRIYDSIDRQQHEFGFGWHLGFSGFQISTNRALGDGGWSATPTVCFIGFCQYVFRTSTVHAVTVTFPDGRQEIFDFTPTAGVGPFFWLGSAAFTARAGTGTTSMLEVDGDPTLSSGFDGTLREGIEGSLYSPTRFILTTQAKQVLHLDAIAGLVAESDPNGNSVSVDSTGIHASNGTSILFTLDSAGRITKATLPGGAFISYAYSNAGDLTGITYPNGNTVSHSYDAQHLLLKTSGPGNQPFNQQRYDSTGRLVALVDGSGNVTPITNDIAGQRQIIVSPSGRLTTIDSFNDRGDLIRRDKVGSGRTVSETRTFDSLGRQLSYTDPKGHSTSATYDEGGHVLSQTDARGNVTRFSYTPEGYPLSQTQPDGTVATTLAYDTHGNVITEQRGAGASAQLTQLTYDAAGHTTTVTDTSGRKLLYAYDSFGHLASVTDSLGNVSQVTVDANGLVTRIGNQLGAHADFSYDGNGNLLTMADALGNTQSFTYDVRGNILSRTDAFGHTETNSYDGAGRLVVHTNRSGETVSYTYDADGRMTSKTLSDPDSATYVYDDLGDLLQASNDSAVITYTYDDAGNMTSVVSTGTPSSPQPSVTHTYTYDESNAQITATGPGGTVRYGYDADVRIQSITDPANGRFQFNFDPLNRVSSFTRPNGITDVLTYTPSEELASVGSSTNLVSYGYDAGGNRTSRTDFNGTSSYGYDKAGQLLSATHPTASGLSNESYSYDASGNRTSGGNVYSGNRLLQDAAATYTYDLEGNVATRTDRSSGAVTRYAYDAEHKLTAVTLPDGTVESYRYDALGSRIEVAHGAQVTHYGYDEDEIDSEYDRTNTLVATYVHGLNPDAILESSRNGQRFFHHLDGQASATAITDVNGAVVAHYSYDSFGNPSAPASFTNPFTYTGREYSSNTGLYYYRNRYYDPRTGRFLSEDGLPSVNPYVYVGNDPALGTDPSGASDAAEYGALAEEDALLLKSGEANVDVYVAVQKSGKCYFGITKDIVTRGNSHARRGLQIVEHFQLQVTRNEARVVEQTLINRWGGAISKGGTQLVNKISSIAEGSPFFQLTVKEAVPFLDAAAVLDSASLLATIAARCGSPLPIP